MDATSSPITLRPDLTRPETVEAIVSESARLVDRLAVTMASGHFFVKPGKVLPYGCIFSIEKGLLVLPVISQVVRQETSGRTFLGDAPVSFKDDLAFVRNLVSLRLEIPLPYIDILLWAPHFSGRAEKVVTEMGYPRFVAAVERRMQGFREPPPEIQERFSTIARSLNRGAPTQQPRNEQASRPTVTGTPMPPAPARPPAAFPLADLRLPAGPGARKGLGAFVASLRDAMRKSGGALRLETIDAILAEMAKDAKEAVVLRGSLEGVDPKYERLGRPLAMQSPACTADEVWEALSAEFPWMEAANVEIARDVAIGRGSGASGFRSSPFLLLGRPGIGKTRYARRVAEILGLPYTSVSCAGMNSSMAIRGSERGWSGGRPSLPVGVFLSTETANPMILLDEIDKASGDTNGHPHHALLSFLEPETAECYRDEYLMADVDCSAIVWMMTANDVAVLPPALLSRVRSVWVEPPKDEHFELLVDAMAAEIAGRMGISAQEVVRMVDLAAIRREFGKSIDLRGLRKELSAKAADAVWKPPTRRGPEEIVDTNGTVVPFLKSAKPSG